MVTIHPFGLCWVILERDNMLLLTAVLGLEGGGEYVEEGGVAASGHQRTHALAPWHSYRACTVHK